MLRKETLKRTRTETKSLSGYLASYLPKFGKSHLKAAYPPQNETLYKLSTL